MTQILQYLVSGGESAVFVAITSNQKHDTIDAIRKFLKLGGKSCPSTNVTPIMIGDFNKDPPGKSASAYRST